jgi:hypothetical protein
VREMKNAGTSLSLIFPSIPIVVLSTKIYVILNGVITCYTVKNIQLFMDKFNKHSHVIVIANRLSTRGMNYTNSTYSRFITHQISMANSSYTNFLQKCRIFGIRNNNTKGKVYCMILSENKCCYVNNLKKKITQTIDKITNLNIPPMPKPKKITIKELKVICKNNKLKRYSKLKKDEIIQLLNNNNIQF